MTAPEAAHARAHAALVRELGDVDDPHQRASDVLGLLRRMGWRWSPALTEQTDPARPPAPPPTGAWAEARKRVAAQAEADLARMKEDR